MHSLYKLQVVNWISTKGEQFLDKHTEIGDSIGHVKTLQEDFENFENKAKVMCGSRPRNDWIGEQGNISFTSRDFTRHIVWNHLW